MQLSLIVHQQPDTVHQLADEEAIDRVSCWSRTGKKVKSK